MVQMYTVAGRQVGSHVLAMATLGATGLGAWLSMRGGKAAEPQQSPPLNAKSKEEENFIKNFVNKAEGGDKKH